MVFDKLREKISGEDDEVSTDICMPADPDIVERTAEHVEIEREVVEETVKRFQEVAAMIFPMLDDKTVRADDATSAKDSETPSFLYAVYEDDDVLVVGGAKNILLNLADRLELSNSETRAVTLAHKFAGDANGVAEHMVMDDIFVVPKEQRFASRLDSDGRKEDAKNKLREKMDEIEKVEEDGFVLQTSERFGDTLNLESKKYFGVNFDYDRNHIRLALDPKSTGSDKHAVIMPNGNVCIPREIGIGFDLKERHTEWKMEDGKVVGKIESKEPFDEDGLLDIVRTSIVEDNVRGEIQAHLPGSHTRELGLEDEDEVAFYLEPAGERLALVLTEFIYEAPTDTVVDVQNIGTGTEMLCFTVPDEHADLLGIDDGRERQVEWGLRDGELVGRIVRTKM